MKFLVAFVASANAAAYVVCSYTQTFYATADTKCTGTASGTEATKVLVNVCSYNAAQTKWFKVTECTKTTIKHQWHSTAACSDTPVAAKKTDITKVGDCFKTNSASTDIYTKIATLAGDAAAKVCGAKIEAFTDNACGTADTATPTYPNRGIPAAGGVWILNVCYYMGATSQYYKWTACTAANNWTIKFFTDKACGTAATNSASIDTSSTNAASKCGQVFNGTNKYAKVSAVLHTHTVTQPVAAASSDSKSLVVGAMVAVSMMYL